jgi:hypothetical protein
MLTQDPQYREFFRRDGGDRTRADLHAQGTLAKAQAELEQARVNDANQIAQGIGLVLEKFGEVQEDGSNVFEGNTLRFSSGSSEISVENIQSGAITFHIKDGQLLKHNVNSDLRAKVNTMKQALQGQKIQEEQNLSEQKLFRKKR